MRIGGRSQSEVLKKHNLHLPVGSTSGVHSPVVGSERSRLVEQKGEYLGTKQVWDQDLYKYKTKQVWGPSTYWRVKEWRCKECRRWYETGAAKLSSKPAKDDPDWPTNLGKIALARRKNHKKALPGSEFDSGDSELSDDEYFKCLE